ncbi:MAG: cupin domain-containing protein [Candidatus Omnitrophota bacterium]
MIKQSVRIFTIISFVLFLQSGCSRLPAGRVKESLVSVEKLVKTTRSWDGNLLPAYPPGQPEVTISRITIPAGTRIDTHSHPVINAGVLISGQLTVVTTDGKTLHLNAGDPIVEVVNTMHYGINQGDVPADIIVFYAGAVDHGAMTGEEKYAAADFPCPVLNSPDFEGVFGGKDGGTLKRDEKGLIREVEFIAFPGTVFEIVSRIPRPTHVILQVTTAGYPSHGPLYIDSRFVTFLKETPLKKASCLLPADKILSSLQAMEGAPYTWGGNYRAGIKQMLTFYQPSGPLSPEDRSLWELEGVDCSGLIYEASGGYTPRNTSMMVNFGEGLKISGLSAMEIVKKVKPLDLIVLPGHVVIVLDSMTAIESTHPDGVKRSDLLTRLELIMAEKVPVDKWEQGNKKIFVIRRWHDGFNKTQKRL